MFQVNNLPTTLLLVVWIIKFMQHISEKELLLSNKSLGASHITDRVPVTDSCLASLRIPAF
jgi:hypothetical protein